MNGPQIPSHHVLDAPAVDVGSTGRGWGSLARWPARRWWTAAVAGVIVTLAIGIPTEVIPNPVFGRPLPVTWWSYPALAITAVLGGLLAATYVRDPATPERLDRAGRLGGLGGILTFFAVGCPVCNKLVIVAIGTTGARQWFEPVQPWIAAASIVLLAVALHIRLRIDPLRCER